MISCSRVTSVFTERNKADRSGQHRSAPPALLYMISGLCSGALYYRDISSYNGPITALNTIRPAIDRKYIKRKYHLPRKSHKQQTETIRAWSERNISSIYISFYFAIFLEDTWGISLPIVHLFLKVFKSLGNFPEQRSWRTIYFVSYWGRQLSYQDENCLVRILQHGGINSYWVLEAWWPVYTIQTTEVTTSTTAHPPLLS